MPVHGFVGTWGSGKSYAAVVQAGRAARKRGVPIVSNLELRIPGVESVVEDEPEGLLSHQNCIVLLDEVGIIMSSRLYGRTTAKVLVQWAQMRKYRIWEVYWTAQSVARADVIVRELTWEVTEMTSYRRLGLFLGKRYQGASLQKGKGIGLDWYWVNPEVFGWYDTMAVMGQHLLEVPEGVSPRGRRD